MRLLTFISKLHNYKGIQAGIITALFISMTMAGEYVVLAYAPIKPLLAIFTVVAYRLITILGLILLPLVLYYQSIYHNNQSSAKDEHGFKDPLTPKMIIRHYKSMLYITLLGLIVYSILLYFGFIVGVLSNALFAIYIVLVVFYCMRALIQEQLSHYPVTLQHDGDEQLNDNVDLENIYTPTRSILQRAIIPGIIGSFLVYLLWGAIFSALFGYYFREAHSFIHHGIHILTFFTSIRIIMSSLYVGLTIILVTAAEYDSERFHAVVQLLLFSRKRLLAVIAIGFIILYTVTRAVPHNAQQTAMTCVAVEGYVRVEEKKTAATILIVGLGEDAHFYTKYKNTPLQPSAYLDVRPDIIRLWLLIGENPNVARYDGLTPLHEAAAHAETDVIQLLLDWGANINASSRTGKRPLHYAVLHNNLKNTKCLLADGANIDARDIDGITPLGIAIAKEYRETAEYLLQHGADVNNADAKGGTPLQYITASRHEEYTLLLLHYGAMINARNKENQTALMAAAYTGNEPVANSLLAHNAQINLRDIYSNSALCYAVNEKHYQLAHLLLEHGASVSGCGKAGRTPLFSATRQKNIQMVSLLLSHGANPHEADDHGETPYDVARKTGNKEILTLFQR